MKLVPLIFLFVVYTVLKGMILSDIGGIPEIVFPTFDTPDIDFIDLSGGCAGFTDCTEYLANAVINIGAGLIFLVLFVIELIGYVFELFALITMITFTGFEGAPFYVNLFIIAPQGATVALILYKLVRSGEANAG